MVGSCSRHVIADCAVGLQAVGSVRTDPASCSVSECQAGQEGAVWVRRTVHPGCGCCQLENGSLVPDTFTDTTVQPARVCCEGRWLTEAGPPRPVCNTTRPCFTVQTGDPFEGAPGSACVFPFTWQGQTHCECAPLHTNTTVCSGSPGPCTWCSLAVDAQGVHLPIRGAFGVCSPTCSDTTFHVF